MEELFIKAEEGGMRIDKFLADELPELTRSHIQKLIKEEMISVNSYPVKANYKLNSDDAIFVRIP